MLDDAQVEYQQALETATIHANILNGTLDTFASLINNNLSNVMKYMTAAAILLAVPTVITSAYGMNVELPMQGFKHAFAVITAISGCFAFGLIAFLFYLYKKRVF